MIANRARAGCVHDRAAAVKPEMRHASAVPAAASSQTGVSKSRRARAIATVAAPSGRGGRRRVERDHAAGLRHGIEDSPENALAVEHRIGEPGPHGYSSPRTIVKNSTRVAATRARVSCCRASRAATSGSITSALQSRPRRVVLQQGVAAPPPAPRAGRRDPGT